MQSASLFRQENEVLAEKYKNAQASLNLALSLKARSVHSLHVDRYMHMPMCVYISSSLILFVSNIFAFYFCMCTCSLLQNLTETRVKTSEAHKAVSFHY